VRCINAVQRQQAKDMHVQAAIVPLLSKNVCKCCVCYAEVLPPSTDM